MSSQMQTVSKLQEKYGVDWYKQREIQIETLRHTLSTLATNINGIGDFVDENNYSNVNAFALFISELITDLETKLFEEEK
jgi:hypothetical protein